MSYWSGAARRLIPALLVGAVVGLVGLLFWDSTAALLAGGATFIAATLLPVKQTRE